MFDVMLELEETAERAVQQMSDTYDLHVVQYLTHIVLGRES